ncbi:phage major capsid protein [Patescibacteria group bacterium]|nr:phage major capsid protein [Patescibacteria group bacterium]
MKELKDKLTAALTKARDLAAEAEKAGRDFTTEEREQVKALLAEAADLKSKIAQAEGDDALRKQIADLGAGIEMAQTAGQTPGRTATTDRPGRGKSIGERFIEAEGFKRWMAQFPNGQIPESAKQLMSPPVGFKDLLTGLSDTSAGAFVQTDYTGIYEPLGRRPLTIQDLIARRTTSSDIVEFVRQTVQVTESAPTAEATSTSSGGDKPEGAMTFEKVTATVRTIAVWIPATKRALSDASQLRGIIDQELRDDLAEDLEDEMINGDNTGEHLYGVMNYPGTLAQAWDTDMLTTARKAITTVRVTGRSVPTAWVVNPADSEAIDLLKDEVGRFYYGGPMSIDPRRLWGYPVVECEAVPEGTGIIGDWRKAVLWDREQATLSISDSHADFFIRNMVAILAELRATFGLIRPHAFCLVDLAEGS